MAEPWTWSSRLKGAGPPRSARNGAAAAGVHTSDGLGLGSERGKGCNKFSPQSVHRLKDRVKPIISQPIQLLCVALTLLEHARQQRPNLGVIHASSVCGQPGPERPVMRTLVVPQSPTKSYRLRSATEKALETGLFLSTRFAGDSSGSPPGLADCGLRGTARRGRPTWPRGRAGNEPPRSPKANSRDVDCD
jgi:hypothetical protein